MTPSSVHSTGHDSTLEIIPTALAPAVLVVDGSETCRDSLISLLRISGYRAIGAPNARVAMALLPGWHPVLIVSDLRVLASDAGSLLAYCRTEHPDVPILMLAHELPDAPPEVESGMAGFLLKPIDAGKFCSAVSRVIARAAHTRDRSFHVS
jgi:DNA-binding NtrC family response regulator